MHRQPAGQAAFRPSPTEVDLSQVGCEFERWHEMPWEVAAKSLIKEKSSKNYKSFDGKGLRKKMGLKNFPIRLSFGGLDSPASQISAIAET
ncbi:MAG TPA: hypothetical protein VMP01_11755 [Pirellulaceae bacterium]|nr:hypothetical protein [Pirellulaceae bacterium]